MTIARLVLLIVLQTALSAQAGEPTAAASVKVFGEGTVWRESDSKDSRGLSIPPWKRISIVNVFGFHSDAATGDMVTIVPLTTRLKHFDLPVAKSKKRSLGCSEQSPPEWEIEFRPLTAPVFFQIAAEKNKIESFPFDVAVIYPAVIRADLINPTRIKQELLPDRISAGTIKAAIDLTGDGAPDLLIVEFCCRNPKQPAGQCDLTCGKSFKKIGNNWTLLRESTPC